jgi:hypothetical protein
MKWQIILDQVKNIVLLSNSSPSNVAFSKKKEVTIEIINKDRIGVGLLGLTQLLHNEHNLFNQCAEIEA